MKSSETPNETVRRLREERGLTLQQMSDECGIGVAMLSRIQNGLRINGDNAIALSRWSGLPIETFYPVAAAPVDGVDEVDRVDGAGAGAGAKAGEAA